MVEQPISERPIRKIVVAYSGGLDTSIIIPFLKDRYPGAEVICVCVNTGQEEDWGRVRHRAQLSGASKLYVVDARDSFIRHFLFPMLRAGAVYEDRYLLGTAIARPIQAGQQVRIALQEGADALAHGCTGKGNDQIRFELVYRALAPRLKIIAPWRLWDIRSREDAIAYARERNISIGAVSEINIYSRDWNIWHTSHEGGDLEDPDTSPPSDLFKFSVSPQLAPDRETTIAIDFERGVPIAIDGKALEPIPLLERLNRLGGENGIGRIDIVETRLVGMKSRGVYETPGGTILHVGLRELETLVLDHDTLLLKRSLARRYADLIYNGRWYSHLRECIDAYIEESCRYLTGTVRLTLYKGNIVVAGRSAPQGLYSRALASFGAGSYRHADAEGFIRLYGLSTDLASQTQATTMSPMTIGEQMFDYRR